MQGLQAGVRKRGTGVGVHPGGPVTWLEGWWTNHMARGTVDESRGWRDGGPITWLEGQWTNHVAGGMVDQSHG